MLLIAPAIAGFKLPCLKPLQVFTKRLPDQRRTVHPRPSGGSIRGAEQFGIQHHLNRFHTVERIRHILLTRHRTAANQAVVGQFGSRSGEFTSPRGGGMKPPLHHTDPTTEQADLAQGNVWTSTESTAGRSRTMGAQLSPASADKYTCPPVVPKYTPHLSSESTAIASRSTLT